ncbi:MAG: PEP/pyruvate-binding domain-containing protein, partial [Candidatus Nanohalobium sp.]
MNYAVKIGEGSRFPDPKIVGRKGMRLMELAETEEVNVPPGAVATTETYQEFIDNVDVSDRQLPWIEESGDIDVDWIEDEIRRSDRKRGQVLQDIHATTTEAFDRTEVPEEARTQIMEVLDFARSNAVNEDHYLDAGAGQMESQDFSSPEAFEDAYKTVLSSAFRPKSLSTFVEDDLFDGFGGMAVVLQQKIDAHGGGVSFSTDQNDADVLNISAADSPWAAVESEVNDNFYVDKEALEEDRDQLSWDHKQVEEDAEHRLSDEQVDEVARVNHLIEQMYPQDESMDTEFAFDEEGELYIVQTRPYTGEISEDLEFGIERSDNGYALFEEDEEGQKEELLEVNGSDIVGDTEMGSRGCAMHQAPAAVITSANTDGYDLDGE